MAAIYRAAVRSASLTAAGNFVDLRSAASDRLYLRSLKVTVGVAGAAPTIALRRPTTVGTASTSTAGQPEDVGSPAATGVLGSAWTVAPIGSTLDLDRVTLAAALGGGYEWIWPPGEELVVPVSSSLIVALVALSAATATAVDVSARWVE